MKKIWLIFWWLSNEHDVSILSAKNVEKYIDKEKYILVCIYWSRDWVFSIVDSVSSLSNGKNILIEDMKQYIDTALLMTHGKYWEDGKLQSLLELFSIPYCWCRVLSSALCMDKWVFKTFVQGHAVLQTSFEILDMQLDSIEERQHKLQSFVKKVRLPLYVKPANSWSSVGITKVSDLSKLDEAISMAALHDTKIVIEEWLSSPKEIEVALLWNDDLTVSSPWELVLEKEFYDYDDKYVRNQSSVKIPADISQEHHKEIQKIAASVYKLCHCSWFARIDFFISEGKIYLNEINTLPGFTDISMFPMLMKHSWLNNTQIIDAILDLAY